jgi:pyruvate kinase
LEQLGIKKNEDIKKRATKIVCTLGRSTKSTDALCKMIEKGMDVARLNMNYFEVSEQGEIISNIKKACEMQGKDCAIMVDLKGPLIRTLGFQDGLYSIKVTSGQEVRISTN